MYNYDISHVPPAVHDAVLHLMETLVQAFPPATKDGTDDTPLGPQGPQHTGSLLPVPVRPVGETHPAPTMVQCPHGTREIPCCAACTTLSRAEAVLVDVQTDGGQQRFPRSAVELRVLEALQALSPMPATPIQVAALVGVFFSSGKDHVRHDSIPASYTPERGHALLSAACFCSETRTDGRALSDRHEVCLRHLWSTSTNRA